MPTAAMRAKKKKNPQDLTLRNLRALKARLTRLERLVKQWIAIQRMLKRRLERLELR